MQTTSFKIGEKVRHSKRPEWGVGSIAKIEVITREGRPDRRIWIRFPNVGEKTVLASMAELEHVEATLPTGGPTLADLHARSDAGCRTPLRSTASMPAASSSSGRWRRAASTIR